MQDVEVVTYGGADEMAAAVSGQIADALRDGLEKRGRALLIATGGSTAPLVYDHLCRERLDWGAIHVVLSDERWVKPCDPACNARLVRERLLVGAAASAQFAPFELGGASPQEAARRFNRQFPEGLCAEAALLGMGADLHVASVFPQGEGMATAFQGDAVAVSATPKPLPVEAPYPRITLSLATLAGAKLIRVVMMGAKKAQALRAAMASGSNAPALELSQRANGRITFNVCAEG